jgi:hypothetical protein
MNLTKTAEFVKKFLRYFVLIVGSYYLFAYILLPGSINLIKAIFTKKTPPNPIYNQLDQLEFVKKKINNENPTYVLNTPNAKLPTNLPLTMKVYKFKPQQYSYLAGKNASAEAAVLGFTDSDLRSDLSGDVYSWRNSRTMSTLTININSRELDLDTDLNGKSSNFNKGSISKETALVSAINTMSSIYRFNDDLYPKGTQNIKLGYYIGNKVYETDDQAEAQLALVDFYRSIEEYPILGPDPSKGLMRIVVSKNSKNPNPLNNPILEANYWEIETETKSMYPIIKIGEAWDMVLNNKAVITQVTPKKSNPFDTYYPVSVEKIMIDSIYLAYYETPKYQTYLQPIYVFSGTFTTRGTEGGDIVLYFPAVTGEWTKQQ